MTKEKIKPYIPVILLLFMASVLFICNLGNHYLWQDEAQTALLSKTILTEGVPKGYDGTNYFSQEEGAEYGKNHIWKWHTWLPFYVVATFFKLFGISTFVARLPFALFGIACVLCCYYFCKTAWQNKKIALASTFLLITCIPFLILSRQCRYFSMTAFFSLWGLLSYLHISKEHKYSSILFVIASTLLFHAHYIYCVTLLATTIIHSVFFDRKKLKRVLLLSFLITLINGPWIIWLSSMKYGDQYGNRMFDLAWFSGLLSQYLSSIGKFIFTPYLFLTIPMILLGNKIKTGKFWSMEKSSFSNIVLLLIFLSVNLIALSMVSPYPFFRYLSPLVPVLMILAGYLIVSTSRLFFLLPIIIIGLLLFTGSIGDFLYEITHDYDGPIEGIVKYLNEHSEKNDIILVSYGDMPLKFYTDLRITGGLTGEDLSVASDPDWIIIRKHIISDYTKTVLTHVRTLNIANYKRIVLDYPDIPFENREEPFLHQYRTYLDEDRVVIHKRK